MGPLLWHPHHLLHRFLCLPHPLPPVYTIWRNRVLWGGDVLGAFGQYWWVYIMSVGYLWRWILHLVHLMCIG